MTTTPTPIDFAVYWSDNARLHAKVPELCRVCEGTGLMHATADEQQFMQDPTQRIHDCLFCPTIGEMLRKCDRTDGDAVSERLDDERVAYFADPERWSGLGARALAREVQESRRLIADLLAMRCPRHDPSYREGYVDALSEVRQRIEQASP